MKEIKKQVNFRLSAATIRDLENMSKRHNLSMSQIISVLVHHYNSGADMDELDTWFEIASRS